MPLDAAVLGSIAHAAVAYRPCDGNAEADATEELATSQVGVKEPKRAYLLSCALS